MSEEDAKKAEELLSQSSEQKRHQTDPIEADASETDEQPDLTTAIREQYAEIDAGDKPENVTVRDKNLVALLDGLDDAGELEDVIDDAREHLGREGDVYSRSEAARLLVRLGLNDIAPEAMEEAAEARRQHEIDDIEF